MGKKTFRIEDIYHSVDMSSFDGIGYKHVDQKDFNIRAFKEARLDEDNTRMIELSITHPVFFLLDKNQNVSSDVFGSLKVDYTLTEEERFKKNARKNFKRVCKKLVYKYSHKGEIDTLTRMSLTLGDYRPESIIFTDDEIKVVSKWNPTCSKMMKYIKLKEEYSNNSGSDDEEWHEVIYGAIQKLEDEIINDIWNIKKRLNEKGIVVKRDEETNEYTLVEKESQDA